MHHSSPTRVRPDTCQEHKENNQLGLSVTGRSRQRMFYKTKGHRHSQLGNIQQGTENKAHQTLRLRIFHKPSRRAMWTVSPQGNENTTLARWCWKRNLEHNLYSQPDREGFVICRARTAGNLPRRSKADASLDCSHCIAPDLAALVSIPMDN